MMRLLRRSTPRNDLVPFVIASVSEAILYLIRSCLIYFSIYSDSETCLQQAGKFGMTNIQY